MKRFVGCLFIALGVSTLSFAGTREALARYTGQGSDCKGTAVVAYWPDVQGGPDVAHHFINCDGACEPASGICMIVLAGQVQDLATQQWFSAWTCGCAFVGPYGGGYVFDGMANDPPGPDCDVIGGTPIGQVPGAGGAVTQVGCGGACPIGKVCTADYWSGNIPLFWVEWTCDCQ